MESRTGRRQLEPLRSAWKSLPEIRCRTLTPVWAGGAKAGACETAAKGSTFIGSLRYWAEQVCRTESGWNKPCTGGSWCGQRRCEVCGAFGSTDESRRFFVRFDGLSVDEGKGGLWSDDFRVRIYSRHGEQYERAAKLAGAAFVKLAREGGFGARTQHGYGQIVLAGGGGHAFEAMVPPVENPRESLAKVEAVRRELRKNLGANGGAVLGDKTRENGNPRFRASFVEMGIRQTEAGCVIRVWCITANRFDPPSVDWEGPLRRIIERVAKEGWECLG